MELKCVNSVEGQKSIDISHPWKLEALGVCLRIPIGQH